ncbi:MAG: cyclic pyranopterin monophosphate synthase MoaC [Candidatus Firestonebacteria bacterium]
MRDSDHFYLKFMVKMIDVSNKEVTKRVAIAKAEVILSGKLINLIKKNKIPKGNVLQTAKLAGIMAAKKVKDIIPLCHQINCEGINIDIKIKKNGLEIISEVIAEAKTGVEMEALLAVVSSALTVYDMCKMIERGIKITNVMLIKKTGGKTGDYVRAKQNVIRRR